jgi:type I restriction enzyme, S subunit
VGRGECSVSELPKGWASSSLIDIINLHDSQRIPLNQKQRSERPGEYPYYGANGQVDSINDFIFDGDYVLLAEDGGYFDDPTRNVAYEVSGRFWVNNHAHILSTRQEIPRRFLTYVLNSLDWMPHVGGSTRLKLTQESMRRVLIPLPPVNEQRRIVAKLDSLFARSRRAREELERISGLCDRYRRSVLAAACSGRLTADWREEQSTTEWVDLELRKILSEPLSNGRSVRDAEHQGFPVLRLTCLKNGSIDLSERKSGAWTRDEATNFLVREGDFLVSRGNGSLSLVGRGGIVPSLVDDIAYPDTLIRIRVQREIYNIDFLSIVWRSQCIRKQIEQAARTTAGIHKINQKSMEGFILPIPPLEEQKEIVLRVEKLFHAIAQIEAEYQKALKLCDRLDQAILTQAFSGQLVPQDPTDEPAGVLLDRIRREKQDAPKAKKVKSK